jgi:ElaB/YqjD/DUF883 family membrane-anchored ribosome-binding protein
VKHMRKNRHSSVAVANGEVREQLGVIGEDLRTLGRQVRQMTTRQLHDVGDRAKAIGENFGKVVGHNPFRSVLIAAGVGALAGLLFWRR